MTHTPLNAISKERAAVSTSVEIAGSAPSNAKLTPTKPSSSNTSTTKNTMSVCLDKYRDESILLSGPDSDFSSSYQYSRTDMNAINMIGIERSWTIATMYWPNTDCDPSSP